MAFNISQPIDVRSKCANIDVLYGPYNSFEDACSAIIPARRVIGRTVGIINNGSILEYWWKAGLEDSDLVQKVEQLNLTLQSVGETSFTKDEGEPIYAQFRVDGGAGVKRAMLYQVTGGSEVYIQDYTNIGKGSPYTFNIPNPAMSGVYTYRIKVLDNLDSYATTTEDTNYVEYTLYYGGISTIYNMTNLNAIKVKNYTSVADVEFQINISVRDSSFSVNSVILTDGTDQEGHRIPLTPYTSQGEISDAFIGNYHYYMPNSSTLERFDGQEIYIEVGYTEDGVDRVKTQDFFRLLDVGIIELIPEHEGDNYYATLPGYYSFTIQAGVENLSITLTRGIDTDFDFEQSTVSAYRRFTLKVVPHDIEKDNAQLVMRYFYIYDNREYSGTITRTIGNILPIPPQSYYEPEEGSTVSRETLVYADVNDNDGSDDGQYYKIISEDVTNEQQLFSSFILDTYCKINQKNDKGIKYITITYGGVEIATVTEDEISCTNKWGSLYTDTPINEWTQIGIGINLYEGVQRGEEMKYGYYHAIYINGMVVKTVQIDSSNEPLYYNQSSRLVVTIGNGVLVQKSFLYYRNDGQNIISPNTDIESIIYNNYKSHKANFHEPEDGLPVLKFLRISDTTISDNYFNLINAYKSEPEHEEDLIVHTAKFGKIGDTKFNDMAHYDPYYSSPVIESNATLFSQSVNIKKPAQKEYAVLCQAKWGDDIMRNIIVECHTQGTSTLVYAVPNFKFTFWELYQDQGVDKVKKYYPRFIKKEGTEDEYYHECVYTAKADFMDSSHLNNTPTCNYYNKLIKDILDDGNVQGFTGSPSARNGMLDAIMGFPIVMEISDNAESFEDKFTNIGSFMLNIDKTGNSLGFEVEEGGQTLSCISFEGTSNDNDNGASGRFDIPDEIKLPYGNGQYSVTIPSLKVYNTDAEIETDYNTAKAAIKNLSNVDALLTLPYVQWCNFLSQGLEYRYPDSDMYKEKNDKVSKIMSLDHFTELYHMWYWVYTSDALSKSDYQTGFRQHFDLYYCMIYFINLMTYAQTDNLGKNAMFDYWFGDGKWYPRPYDLDSECGLDNNGNDNVAPFVEIRAPFSLNYDVSKENDWEWRAEQKLIDDNDVAENPDEHLTKSTIQYGSQTYDRYHFSSNKSKLWINFYKNFKDEIEAFYANIRDKFNYGPESIIELCDNVLIEKLGTNQYNQDFQNKYLATKDQTLGYGNRWYKFKKWITKRFAFCDSYFGATETATYNVISRINYNIKVDAPQYVAQRYQSNLETKFVLETVSFNAGSGAATKTTLLVNQPSVFETSLFKYVDLDSGDTNFRNLITLDVSGNQNSGFNNITKVTGTNLDNLKYLNISNSAVRNLTVPPNVKTLLAENVNLSSFTIPDGCAVEEISLKGSTFLDAVDFSMLPNLRRLDLTECTFNQSVTFANLPQLEELIMNKAIFNGDVVISAGVHVTSFNFTDLNIHSISFSGSDLEIDTINFHNTKFGVSSINVNAITKNIRDLYFDNCQGLEQLEITDSTKFRNLNCLSLYGSSIKALGANNTIFDCSHFNNMSSLKKVNGNSWNPTTGMPYSFTGFTFNNTVIEKITNILWTGTGSNLFADCRVLTSIDGTINLTTSMDSMFYRCYVLTTLPTININTSVTSATYLFAGCNALSYNSVASVISRCTKVADFTAALRCKQFDNGQTISLNALLGGNTATTLKLDSFISQYVGGGVFPSVTNDVVITGTIPSNVTSATWLFYGFRTISVPYNILSTASNLSDASDMFSRSTITFTGDNLPFVTDSYDVQITLSNAVNRNFFNTALSNIARMFYNTNVIATEASLFVNLVNLTNTNATFGSESDKAFTFINSQNATEYINLDVSNMWLNNPLITNISGCFFNVYNISCSSLHFNNAITSSTTIDISGLFGLTSSTYKSFSRITIDLDSIVPRLKTDRQFAVTNNSAYYGPGVFQNREVIISSTPVNGKILYNLRNYCRNLFYNTTLYIPESTSQFDISNVTDASSMFYACRLYKFVSTEHEYGLSDRKFVQVYMPTGCSTYTEMFAESSVLSDLPALRSSNASTMNGMYRRCIINILDLELPANYFQICKNALTNVSSMFASNEYISLLQYSSSCGLFEGCVNLNNVSSMFDGAIFLHEGIPVNLFGETELPRLTSLYNMFANSSVIYDVKPNSNKWFNSETIAPLINLDNIRGLFYRTRIHLNQFTDVGYGTMNHTVRDDIHDVDVPIIEPSTFSFKTFSDIRYMFDHTVYNPPESAGGFRFLGFTLGQEAFFGSAIANIGVPFVDPLYSSSIVNADRMFYQPPNTGQRYGNYVKGLSSFVTELVQHPNTSKYNIAGNLIDGPDGTIPDIYKQSTPTADQNQSWGHSILRNNSPETTYGGRYIY